jgi:integral membrane protein (TIGR01906 family)
MRDVKALMRNVFRMNEVSMAYVLLYIGGVFVWAGQGSLRRLAWLSLGGVGVGALAVGLVGLAFIGGFEATWDRFHEIVFANDFWQLNPRTDRLIQMFPEDFWFEASLIVGALTIAEALAIVVASVGCLLFAPRGERPTAPPATPRAQAIRIRARRSRTQA